MQALSAAEIREKFLQFFAERGHERVPSSPLVPKDDPTLLFTNAGMVQFKDYFTGHTQPPYPRATTAQKCVRAGGKHNDLENVGKTARHHTFFEMMGNFSFGDYFKREAIQYAWTFLTEELGFPKDRLYATIFEDDDEAEALWLEETEVPKERIVRLGEKDNFWAMGDTGPCGPCSELIFDRGEEYACEAPTCALGVCDCDRWLEVWNLVFMQYERDSDGNLHPLPKPSIDTGMGLERVASLVQDVRTNWDTDLFTTIIGAVGEITGKEYDPGQAGFPFRVLADHARAGAFLIADGVLPSNEGRGYVLRRILRRAARFGRVLGMEGPILHRLVPVVSEVMGAAYPELRQQEAFITEAIRAEEERFIQTLDQGMKRLTELVERMRREGRETLSGQEAFVLYDTYGFPVDLLEDVAEEQGFTVDRQGFEAAMAEQRARARADWEARMEGGEDSAWIQALAQLPATRFVGYDSTQGTARVIGLFVDRKPVDKAAAGQEVQVVLDRTPFYAEGGGQVGDQGSLRSPGLRLAVRDTRRVGNTYVHFASVAEGSVASGQEVLAQVNAERRRATMRNHSATHLLHKALKEVVGEHANQAGSLVAPDRLRFDFTHFQPISPAELQSIEERVNRQILAAIPVAAFETEIEKAKALGAMALFGEKYGNVVRCVQMGDYSLELCGGTHVGNTAEIGLLKITSEGSIGSGIRRIEAVTGAGVIEYVERQEEVLAELARDLKVSVAELPGRVEDLLQRVREQEKNIERLQGRLSRAEGENLLDRVQEIGSTRVLAARAPVDSPDALRTLGDTLKEKVGSGVIVLGAPTDGKVALVAMVTADLVEKGLHAGQIVKAAAQAAGGGGGGRPDMAQAGGRQPEKLDAALAAAVAAVRTQLQEA